jgi:membrane-bound serine protease (ClpP class)
VGGTLILVMWLALKARNRKVVTGEDALVGKVGEIHKDHYVFVEGALWRFICDQPLEVGDQVEVIETDKLTLRVKKVTL